MSKGKVMVAMSGGVDSSVAAALLIEQGYEVAGGIMRLWHNSTEDAQKVADSLGIKLYIFDYSRAFEEEIVNYFVDTYTEGKTPNPCIVCNKKFKFGAFLERALELGYDYIATGHYANIVKSENGLYDLTMSENRAKDQSYFLYNMTQRQLSHTLFPVGNYTKDFIREKALKLGLNVAEKKDSQDICFIPNGEYTAFIKNRLDSNGSQALAKPGNYVNVKGEPIGTHQGIINYTIGQRNGLGMGFGKRMYVVSLDVLKNEVVLGDDSQVFSNSLKATQVSFVNEGIFEKQFLNCSARIRYGGVFVGCEVSFGGDMDNKFTYIINVKFEKPVRAVTPGQAVVFYDGERVLGGGTIL